MSSSEPTHTATAHSDAGQAGDAPSLESLRHLLGSVREHQETHDRILRFIAECVAPKGEDSSQINDLIGLLISKIDGQSAMIRSIAGQLHRQGRTLPGDVVQALRPLGHASVEGQVKEGGPGHLRDTVPVDPTCCWCQEMELNHRHTAFRAAALPAELSWRDWRSRGS